MAPLFQPELNLRLVSRQQNQVLRMLDMLWAVLRYGRKEQPVVIDVYSTLNFYYAFAVGILCRLLNIKYCCVLHGGRLPLRLKNNPTLCKELFGHSWQNIAPSGYLKAAFEAAGYSTKLIPNFIPINNYPYKERKEISPRLLWVRAFEETYNPQLALFVLAAVRKLYPEAQLCMVGPDKDGSMEICRALAAELGLTDQLKFTGRLSKADWILLSADYDIFLNTTNVDNTPISVIEAMALGLPIVSTNVGGLPYLIDDGQNGILVPPAQVEAMTTAVLKILSEPNLAVSLSKNAQIKAAGFDWECVKALWLKILQE